MNAWDNDFEFEDNVLTEVRREGDHYSVCADHGWLSIADPGFEPKVGDVARYFGRGFGYPVRGVLINGRLVRYQTPEEHEAERARQSAEFKRRTDEQEAQAKAAGHDEKAMRDSEAPTPKSVDELAAYIRGLVEGPHDYGSCVYAMSLAAVAAYNFAASELGVTGFQASCADMDIIKRTRRLKGPFGLIDGEHMLYPQYDLTGKVVEWQREWSPWAAEEARKLLAQDTTHTHPNVRAHWQKLAALKETVQ